MSLLEAIILAIVQGATEFLPISSSGHMILAAWALGWTDPGLAFDMAVHAGTLVAVLVYFHRDWLRMAYGAITGRPVAVGTAGAGPTVDARRLVVLIVLATAPLGLVGLIFRTDLEDTLREPALAGAALLATAVMLLAGEALGRRNRGIPMLHARDSLVVGVAQAFAALPGISRSGVTIAAGMVGNLDRETAARFSFFLAVPAILGASFFQFTTLWQQREALEPQWGLLFAGAAVACVIGFLAIGGLMHLLRHYSLKPFIVYCAVIGGATVIARAAGL